MSEILLLRLSADPARCAWQRIDRLGNLLGPARDGTLTQAADSIRGATGQVAVWCTVPQTAVRATELKVPVKDRRRARQAALFAIEDRLLSPLDATHVAQADRDRDGRWPQVAVAHTQMQTWVETLSAAGLDPTRMVCESDLLPRDASLCVLWEPDQVLAVTADGRAVTCTPALATQVLARLCDEGAPIRVWSAPGHDPGPALAALGATGATIEHLPLDRPVVAWFADRVRSPGDQVDLIQGRYRSAQHGGRDLRSWGWAAAAALAVFIVQLGTWVADIRELGLQQQTLEQDMQMVWRDAMGPDARFDRYQARSRFEIALRGAGGSAGAGDTDRFLSMLRTLSTAGDGTGVSLQGLVLASGSLQVLIEAPDVSAVQQLASAVTQRSGAVVEIGDVETSGSTVAAQISIRMTEGG
jgi:type II secretion system protein L